MIRIFIGSEPKAEIARKVLEFSIRRRTKATVTCVPMIGPEWEYPTDGITVGTGFSLRRWMIPAACGWSGGAIYLDADQLVFGDIQELWEAGSAAVFGSHNNVTIACTFQPDKHYKKPAPQTSVMMIDCEKARNYPQQFDLATILARLRAAKGDRADYAKLMHVEGTGVAAGHLPTEWNHLNVYQKGVTKLLHYTKEPEQPWYKPGHRLANLWRDELRRALAAKYVSEAEVREAVAKFGQKEDWRKTNGLHPDYLKLLSEK